MSIDGSSPHLVPAALLFSSGPQCRASWAFWAPQVGDASPSGIPRILPLQVRDCACWRPASALVSLLSVLQVADLSLSPSRAYFHSCSNKLCTT